MITSIEEILRGKVGGEEMTMIIAAVVIAAAMVAVMCYCCIRAGDCDEEFEKTKDRLTGGGKNE